MENEFAGEAVEVEFELPLEDGEMLKPGVAVKAEKSEMTLLEPPEDSEVERLRGKPLDVASALLP